MLSHTDRSPGMRTGQRGSRYTGRYRERISLCRSVSDAPTAEQSAVCRRLPELGGRRYPGRPELPRLGPGTASYGLTAFVTVDAVRALTGIGSPAAGTLARRNGSGPPLRGEATGQMTATVSYPPSPACHIRLNSPPHRDSCLSGCAARCLSRVR